MRLLFFTFACFLSTVSFAYGVSDDFIVRQQVGEDTTPPSTPTLISAVPVSTSQIDLAWSASTDDFYLSGYKVFRDAVQIATTTLTSYSDSGLAASTTYAYFVQAFDTVPYISSSSNSIATTTFASAPTSTPPVEPENTNDAPERLRLVSLEVIPGTNAVEVSWQTNRYARFELRWGKTAAYELGFVTNELYKREHTSRISDLEPGTFYEFELIGYDRNGRQIKLASDRFKTLQLPDDVPPANVGNLHALVRGNDIVLFWENPNDPDFARVRIVRSYYFYPADPGNGVIVYQGSGEAFTDARAAKENSDQYYTVFTYDTEGNISSGAGVRVVLTEARSDVSRSTETLELSFDDVELIQNGERISKDAIDADAALSLRIPYEKFPEHLKSILVTLTHPQDPSHSFTFLLRVNGDKTYYQATLSPLNEAGMYPVTVFVYDHERSVVQELHGTYRVWKREKDEAFLGIPLSAGSQDLVERSSFLWLSLLVFLLFILFRLVRDIISDKQRSGQRALARIVMLFVCTFGVGASAFVVFRSFAASKDATLQASLIGGAATLEDVHSLAIAALILLLCIAVLSVLRAFSGNTKRG